MTDALGGIWWKAAEAYHDIILLSYWGCWITPWKPVRVPSSLDKTQTKHLTNIAEKCHCYANLPNVTVQPTWTFSQLWSWNCLFFSSIAFPSSSCLHNDGHTCSLFAVALCHENIVHPKCWLKQQQALPEFNLLLISIGQERAIQIVTAMITLHDYDIMIYKLYDNIDSIYMHCTVTTKQPVLYINFISLHIIYMYI
jgi:hypothetical protein